MSENYSSKDVQAVIDYYKEHGVSPKSESPDYTALWLKNKVNDLCGWACSSIDNEQWETSCGNSFIILAGTPKDNGFIYCTYCGRKIHEIVIPETEW